MSPIHTLAGRIPSLGRISCGYQDSKPKKGKKGDIVVFPRRSNTLCFHANERDRLEQIMNSELPDGKKIGGNIRQSPTSSESEEKWTLVSATSSIAIHIPAVDDIEKIAPQYLELWSSAGLQKRCDGVNCILHRLKPKEDQVVGDLSHEIVPCICAAEGLAGDDERRCKPVIRLSVVLADLWADMRGLGVWTVSSAGWGSNSALAGELELYRSMLPQVGGAIRFNLVVRSRSSKHGDVPELHLDLLHTPREAAALAAGPQLRAPALPDPDLDKPIGTFADPQASGNGNGDHANEEAPASDAVLTFCGIDVPFVGGTTAAEDGAGITSAQRAVLARHGVVIGDKTGEPFDVGAAFAAYAGHDIDDTSRKTAEKFDSFLKDATRKLEGRLV